MHGSTTCEVWYCEDDADRSVIMPDAPKREDHAVAMCAAHALRYYGAGWVTFLKYGAHHTIRERNRARIIEAR